MKMITAIIQPHKLDEVREELIKSEIYRIMVSRCAGRGQDETIDLYHGQEVMSDLLPNVRLDIACNDDWMDVAVKAILRAARRGEGEIGDGKIFITFLEECIRIRTEERGGKAI